MNVIDAVHGQYVFDRRVKVLAGHLAEVLPPEASVLDVGCGDGSLAYLVMQRRPDIRIRGMDVLLRERTAIPVELFDGSRISAEDNSYDAVMFVDVLHHTSDPMCLLREACRVTRRHVVLKDHTRDGLLAGPTLRFMDRVGNLRFRVNLPYNYWTRRQWEEAFRELRLATEIWQSQLGLYPAWANWCFGRSLHFVTRARVTK